MFKPYVFQLFFKVFNPLKLHMKFFNTLGPISRHFLNTWWHGLVSHDHIYTEGNLLSVIYPVRATVTSKIATCHFHALDEIVTWCLYSRFLSKMYGLLASNLLSAQSSEKKSRSIILAPCLFWNCLVNEIIVKIPV